MIDQAGVVLLSIVVIIFGASITAMHTTLRRDGWKVQKYKLYAVRDQLIYLIATNQIREDDFVFQRFYKAVNYFIETTNHINLGTFIAAIDSARSKGIDPAEENNWKAIRADLRKRSPEVNAVANSFYAAMLEILIENSFPLHLIMKCSSISTVLGIIVRALEPRHTNKAALKYYDDYSRAIAA